MINIGIFCGSANGSDPVYREAASQTGQLLAGKGMGIVYGGGKVGLMGAVADAALEHGGHVTGVIPQSLVEREIAHTGLTHLHVVANMHERKMKMAAQLGLHAKPCAFLDVNGFYRPLQDMIRQMVEQGFLKKSHEDMLIFSANMTEITEYFADYRAPAVKWSQ
ncbi:LOG family protein [Candidatus Sodalis endolongispinus]|uniref:AMP nucleosidase n=1 Tax=Candidatus Sodalis endolongispinus TaxID=2812662 RepID=A0ABS5Y8V5_9GAMM|nr:LOG family protein [Candidatus Sodalis endolongispinus]MBT9431423.1 LOG family protein [Candidatus Sodalis endolongispinus]